MCENSLDFLFVYVREEKTAPHFIIQTSLKEVNSMEGNKKNSGMWDVDSVIVTLAGSLHH